MQIHRQRYFIIRLQRPKNTTTFGLDAILNYSPLVTTTPGDAIRVSVAGWHKTSKRPSRHGHGLRCADVCVTTKKYLTGRWESCVYTIWRLNALLVPVIRWIYGRCFNNVIKWAAPKRIGSSSLALSSPTEFGSAYLYLKHWHAMPDRHKTMFKVVSVHSTEKVPKSHKHFGRCAQTVCLDRMSTRSAREVRHCRINREHVAASAAEGNCNLYESDLVSIVRVAIKYPALYSRPRRRHVPWDCVRALLVRSPAHRTNSLHIDPRTSTVAQSLAGSSLSFCCVCEHEVIGICARC